MGTGTQVVVLLASMLMSASVVSAPKPRDHGPVLAQTGQTSCWDSSGGLIACGGTGQDGDVQAGVAISFVDNGNGTITDKVTGLTWEKKSRDDTLNDFRRIYTWDEAVTVHVATLNAQRFGGYSDWRLPNIHELLTLVNYQTFDNKAVFPEFSIPDCQASGTWITVYTGSCTGFGGLYYWTSTTLTYGGATSAAWAVDSESGYGLARTKLTSPQFVRAVRGGLSRR